MSTVDARIKAKTQGKKYSRLDEVSHVLMRSGMYIGSSDREIRENELIYIIEDDVGKIVRKNIDTPAGLERLFVEILANATDNVPRSLEDGIDPGIIEVTLTPTTISISNGGKPMDVDYFDDEEGRANQEWIPTVLFGSLRSSGNYDEDKERRTSGLNGVGSALVNVFSSRFQVSVIDPIHKKSFVQEWRNNKSEVSDPIVEDTEADQAVIRVEYTADFARFPGYGDHYDTDTIALFLRHCYDAALNSQIPVLVHLEIDDEILDLEFNNVTLDTYIETALGQVNHLTSEWISKDGSQIVKYGIADTPDQALMVPFCNGILSRDGGVLVDAIINTFADKVLGIVNAELAKKKEKGEKNVKLTASDVRPHLSVFVVASLPNPVWTSQTKTKLAKPALKGFALGDISSVSDWDIIDRLEAALDAKNFRDERKIKKAQFVDTPGAASDANWAGSAKSHLCSLYITEGESALGYPKRIRMRNAELCNTIGYLPARGKGINAMNASERQLEKNKVVNDLRTMMGFRKRRDDGGVMDYTRDEDYMTLRYGDLVIFADADLDANHIIGLLINVIRTEWPTFLKRPGTLKYVRTPIIRVIEIKKKPKVTHRFFTTAQYEEWKARHPDYADKRKYKHKYFKGLGTSTKEDIEEDCLYLHENMVSFLFDDSQADDALRLAFDKHLTDLRKRWIEEWHPKDEPLLLVEPISSFINDRMRLYSIASNVRSIPFLTDGLKDVYRKAIFSAREFLGNEEIKVNQIANEAARTTSYHHGDASMSKTIIGMSQDYVGANNIPYFKGEGDFGSRDGTDKGPGKDAAAPRYISCTRSQLMDLIFLKVDDDILERKIDEGLLIEPKTFAPILPLHLINGVEGMGTGWSTSIPPHNPLDVTFWLKQRLQGKETPSIVPWWRGFEGYVGLKESPTKTSVIVTGTFKVTMSSGKYEVRVTEIPIDTSIQKYEKWLDSLVRDKQIKSYQKFTANDKPNFLIKFHKVPAFEPNERSLKLRKAFGMTNMVLLVEDEEGTLRPTKFDSTEDILEAFFNWRISMYEKRKEKILSNLRKEQSEFTRKLNYLNDIFVTKRIRLANPDGSPRDTDELEQELTSLGHDVSLLDLSQRTLTSKKIDEIKRAIESLQTKIDTVEATSPDRMWMDDLLAFEKKYCTFYKVKPQTLRGVKATLKIERDDGTSEDEFDHTTRDEDEEHLSDNEGTSGSSEE